MARANRNRRLGKPCSQKRLKQRRWGKNVGDPNSKLGTPRKKG